MSKTEGKSRKPLIIALIAAAVVLAIVLTLVLTMCTGNSGDNSGDTGPATDTEEYILYWNVDRELYAGKDATGMSSREPNPDTGYFQVLFAMEGRQGQRRVAERRVINKIDNLDLMGIVLDDDGIIVDVKTVEEITGGYAVNKFYVESVDGNTVVVNSSSSLKGMQVELTISEKTKIYDVSGETGIVGCETTLVELDCIIAIQNKAGEITHIYAVEREPQGPTQTKYCDHCKTEVVWRAWAYDTTLPTSKSGHYYLYSDVKLATQQSMTANTEVILDLNGKTVTGSGAGRMYSLHNEGAYLGIMDYSAEKNGKFVVTGNFGAQGGAVWVRYGKFEMWGGTLDASQATNTLNGVTVCIDGNSECNLYGGTWIGGTAQATYNAAAGTTNAGRGGTVMNFGKFNMYGGTIKNGKSKSVFNTKTNAWAGGTGGNVDNHGTNAVFTMSGGTIENGTADGYAGNIYLTSKATVNISGGTIVGGQTLRAGQNGGNIASLGCTLNITGGTIKNGVTRNCGGNVYTSGVFNMSGGTITGGKKLDATTGKEADSYSKNLFVVNGTTTITGGKIAGYAELVPTNATGCIVNISGNPVIYGAPEGSVNLRIPSGTVLNVGKMSSGAKIGVTAAGIISNKTAESNKKYFDVDNSDTEVTYYGGCLCIGEVMENCICGHAHTEEDPGVGDCDGEKLPWMELSGSGTLPSKGNLYLTSDYIVTGQVNVINNTMNLSLNGYNVYFKEGSYGRMLQLRTGAVVNLTNWAKTEGGLFQNTQGFKPDVDGGDCGPVVLVHNYSPDQTYYDLPVLSIYDVTMSARDGDKVAGGVTNGGAITVYSGTMNLFEGSEVIGGKSLDNGGAINVQGGKATLNIKGGKISGGEAYTTKSLVDYTAETPEISVNASGATNYRGGQGGNINIGSGAVVNMTAGEISGGKANVAGNLAIGGNSTLNMSGGTITGGEVGNDIRNNGAHGGNIAVFGTLNLSGDAVISKGIAGNGGNISTQSTVAKINMTGGTITGGQALRVPKFNDDGTPMYVGETLQQSGGTGGNIYMFHVGAVELNLNGGVIEDGYAQWDAGNLYLSCPASTTVKNYKIGAVTIRGGIGNKGGNVYVYGGINKVDGQPIIEGNHTYTFTGTIIEGGDSSMGGAGIYMTAGAKVFLGEGTKVQDNFIRSGSKANGASIYLVGDEGNELTVNGAVISGGLGTDSAANVYLGADAVMTMNDGLIINGGIREKDWTESSAISYTNGNGNIHSVNGVLKLNGGYIDGYTHNNTTSANICEVYISGNPYVGDVSDEICTKYGVEDKTPTNACGMSFGTWGTGVPETYKASRHQMILTGEMTDGAKIVVNGIGGEQGYPFLSGKDNDYNVPAYADYFFTTTGQVSNCQMVGTGSDAYGELYFGMTKCLCGHAHTEEDPGQGTCDGTKLFWSPWNSNNSLPDSGNYYLTTDVTINNKAWRNKTVNIAMNGHNIKSTSNRPLQLQASSKVTITNWTNTTGKITGSKVDGDGGLVLLHLYYPKDDTSITGATLKAPELTLYSVHMDATGIINTKDVNKDGNPDIDIANGGAIFAAGGDKAANAVPGLTAATRYISKVNLYGDTVIENGKAKKGGNIYTATTAELTMDDNAIIRGGTAIDEGGNVRFDYKLTMSGSSSIYGGSDTTDANADHKNVAMVIVNGTTWGTHLDMSENASIAGFFSAWYGDAASLRTYKFSGNVQIVGEKPKNAPDDFVVHGFNWPVEDDIDFSGLTKDAKIMVSANAGGVFGTGVNDSNKDWIADCFEPIPSFDAECVIEGSNLVMGRVRCLCGGTDEHVTGFCDGTKYVWYAAKNDASIKAADGKNDKAYYFYLTSDITWGSYQMTLDNGEKVFIDLNGHNITNGGGGRMFRTLNNPTAGNLTITNTSDKAASIINTSQGIDQGGIIWAAGSGEVNVYNVTLDSSGGKSRMRGTVMEVAGATVEFYNVTVKGGVAQAAVANDNINGNGRGGAISVTSGKFTFNGGAIIGGESRGAYVAGKGNSGSTGGGTFYQSGGTVRFENVDVSGGKAYNYTYNDGTNDVKKDAWGGNLAIWGGNFTMIGGSVKNGYSGNAGGNIYTENATATFENVVVENGEAGWSGGNIFLDTKSTNTFTKCTITGGTAANEGGNIRTRSTTSATFEDCTISGGTSTAGNGGTLNTGSFVTMSGCTITGGNADNVAGCWQINGGANIVDCTISGGTVKGSTTVSTACLFIVGGNTTIENTTVSGNCEIINADEHNPVVTLKGKVVMDDLAVFNFAKQPLIVDSTFDGAASSIVLRNAASFGGKHFATATDEAQAAGFKTPPAVTTPVSYVDGKLYVAEMKLMCLCGETHSTDYPNCDGTKLQWLGWSSKTSLPTEGNWFLTDNVTTSAQYTLLRKKLNLSLNGYSIVTDGNQRVFQLRPSSVVNLTNWGKLTGGEIKNVLGLPEGFDGPTGAIAIIFKVSHAPGDVPSVFNVMDVTLNADLKNNVVSGAAITVDYGTVNLYKGSKVIGGEVSYGGGAIRATGADAVLNVYSGATVTAGKAGFIEKSGGILYYHGATLNNEVPLAYVYNGNNISHCLCGDADGHAANDICDGVVQSWKMWDGTTALPTGNGYWFLPEAAVGYKLGGQAQVAADAHTHLDLNGQTVYGPANGRAYVTFNAGSALTLTDTHTGTAAGKIIGSGTTTNAQTGIIWVRNGDVTIYNVTLDASGFSVNRGAVLNMESGRKAAIYNAKLIGGTVSGHGGAIFGNGENELTIINSTLVGGTADFGDVFRVANSNVTIKGSTMSATTTKQSSVGWIQNTGNGKTVTIENSTINGGLLLTAVANGEWADTADALMTVNVTGNTNIGTASGGGLFISNRYQTVDFTGLTGTVYVGADDNALLTANVPESLMSNLKSATADHFLSWEVEAATDTVGDIYYRPNTVIMNCLCGHEHTQADPGVGDCTGVKLAWYPWNADASADYKTNLPNSGNYYLTDNATVSNKTWQRTSVNIALNGYNIYGKNVTSGRRPLQLQESSTVNLTNWKNTAGGQIVGYYNDGDGGLVLMHMYKTTNEAGWTKDALSAPKFAAYNVNFDATNVKKVNSSNELKMESFLGGALSFSGTTLNSDKVEGLTEDTIYRTEVGLYDCNLNGNTAEYTVDTTTTKYVSNGGCIYTNGGILKMTGTTLSGGIAQARGGNIYAKGNATITATNCTFENGGTAANQGGNIAMTDGSVNFTLNACSVTGGASTDTGRNIWVGSSCTLTLAGTTVDKQGVSGRDNIYINNTSAKLIITDYTLGNEVKKTTIDGSVWFRTGADIKISGNPSINYITFTYDTSNKVGYFYKGLTIDFTGLGANASIGMNLGAFEGVISNNVPTGIMGDCFICKSGASTLSTTMKFVLSGGQLSVAKV